MQIQSRQMVIPLDFSNYIYMYIITCNYFGWTLLKRFYSRWAWQCLLSMSMSILSGLWWPILMPWTSQEWVRGGKTDCKDPTRGPLGVPRGQWRSVVGGNGLTTSNLGCVFVCVGCEPVTNHGFFFLDIRYPSTRFISITKTRIKWMELYWCFDLR